MEALCHAGESTQGVSARGRAATPLVVIEGFWLLTLADDMLDDLGDVLRTIVLLLRALGDDTVRSAEAALVSRTAR